MALNLKIKNESAQHFGQYKFAKVGETVGNAL